MFTFLSSLLGKTSSQWAVSQQTGVASSLVLARNLLPSFIFNRNVKNHQRIELEKGAKVDEIGTSLKGIRFSNWAK